MEGYDNVTIVEMLFDEGEPYIDSEYKLKRSVSAIRGKHNQGLRPRRFSGKF